MGPQELDRGQLMREAFEGAGLVVEEPRRAFRLIQATPEQFFEQVLATEERHSFPAERLLCALAGLVFEAVVFTRWTLGLEVLIYISLLFFVTASAIQIAAQRVGCGHIALLGLIGAWSTRISHRRFNRMLSSSTERAVKLAPGSCVCSEHVQQREGWSCRQHGWRGLFHSWTGPG